MELARDQALRALLRQQELAALGTLRNDEPFVSMVPYALLPDGSVVVHVSRLATHTRDMEEHPGVSLMVVAGRSAGVSAQEVARVTVQGEALPCLPDDTGYAQARQAYVTRFPDAEFMFGFADFLLFRIAPRAVRFVAGFGQAWSFTGAQYAQLMSSASTPP